MLRKLFTAALVAGAITGLISTLAQLWLLQPLLQAAETLEVGHHSHDTSHLVRHVFTLAVNIINYCGFAFVLTALMQLFQPESKLPFCITGLLWGGLGYVAVILSPTLGLSPNLPGMAAAEIDIRQIWWLGAVLTATASCWLAFASRLPVWRYAIAVLVFLAPHIYGAPISDEVSNIPAEWGALFATRSVGISFISWMILGVISARFLYKDSQ